MRWFMPFVVAAVAFAPAVARPQRSHGATGSTPRREAPPRSRPAAPELPRGVLPAGSPRQIEVLVLSNGCANESLRAAIVVSAR
jgi:hypothetical protein